MDRPARSPNFPLYAHANGQWAKRIRGKICYFGKWEDKEGALKRYLAEKDYLLSGVVPPSQSGHTVLEVCDRFIEAKKLEVATGELSSRTFDDYYRNCQLLVRAAGDMVVECMFPDDYQRIRSELAKDVGMTTLSNRIRMARIALRYISEISDFSPRFGKAFKEPSARLKRRSRMESGAKMHSREQILEALQTDNRNIRCMIWLGINCAMGNVDCSRLKWSHLDLENGWHNFHREKAWIERRAKLWPETIGALREIEARGEYVFHTKFGNTYSSTAISHEVAKAGIKFSWLRKTFRTVADETLETMAIRTIMGHARSSTNMDHVYVQKVVDDRLEFISMYVHEWLLGN